MKSSRLVSAVAGMCAALLAFSVVNIAYAAPPVVTAVPGDANNPTVFHQAIPGRPITLKGAVDAPPSGANWSWEWDPGDGKEPYTGVVGDTHWAVWAAHTYDGNPGDFFTATLTVTNDDGTGTAEFGVVLRADSVPTRANVAIAEALWYMHRLQRRFDADELGVQGIEGESTIPMGNWSYGQSNQFLTISAQAATLNAFEANGHRENGDADNPYTETVARGMKYLMARLIAEPLDVQTVGPLEGQDARSDNPDSNGNGVGVTIDNRIRLVDVYGLDDKPYQLGMIMDAIVASGLGETVATTGPDGVIGKTYREIVQDMVDWYAMAQSDSANHGGWRYNAWNNSGGQHDNSTSGWAGTGIVAAADVFRADVPNWLKTRNQNGLELTDTESDTLDSDGQHGYTDNPFPIWGPWGTTGAAMVQMSMNGIAATSSATPDEPATPDERWVRAENFFRRHFDDPATGNNFKNNYYAMFNFAKAMRTAKPAPVTIIGTVVGAAEDPEDGVGCGPSTGCAAEGAKPLDWYNDPVSGLAQWVVSNQATTGANIGQFQDRTGSSVTNYDNAHVQAWATQILTRTLAQAGPIAVGAVTPNPAGEGFPITLDHSRSFHQDPERSFRLFEWDIDGDGEYELSSTELDPDPPLVVEGGFACPEGQVVPCEIQITLRVTDDAGVPVTATDVIILDLSIPPFVPTAIAGGPYSVCVNEELTVDGSASFDIDEGNSEPVQEGPPNPADRITLYEWELDGVSPFDYGEASSADDPTATWTYDTVGIAPIGLRVTDNNLLAFPSSGLGNQTDTDNTFVAVADCLDADLSIVVLADDSNPIIPQAFTITGTVSNGGPDDLTNVTAVIWVPDFVDITSITSAQGSCVATGVEANGRRQYKCQLGDVASGTSIDVVVEVFGDAEGTAEFEFTVAIVESDLLRLNDPDANNNTFTAVINLIDEIIIVVRGKGKGSGAVAVLEVLLLAGFVALVALLRRRRRTLAGTLSVGLVCLLLAAPGGDAVAAEDGVLYVGGGIGDARGEVNAGDFEAGLTAAGYTVSDVMLKEDGNGWKFFIGYMFNDYAGVQLSFVDLGSLESEFTASVPPDEIDALLETATRLLPGRGRGLLADVVLEYPATERLAFYGTLGMFYAEPEARQTVVEGGTGEFRRKDDEQDLAASIGMKIAVGKNFDIRIAYERYDIDGVSTDFSTATFGYRFGQ